jgi:hypothetical protein
MSTLDEKILELLFKDKIVAELLTDTLLPKRKYYSDYPEELTPETILADCRNTVRANLQNLLRED